MKITEYELQDPADSGSILDANAQLIERLAVTTLLDLMSGSADPDIKLAAAEKALRAIGKDAPPKAAENPAPHTLIQIAANMQPITDAVRGLGQAAALIGNAPQIRQAPPEAHDE